MEDEDVHIGSQEFDRSALMFALDRIKLVDNPVCARACVIKWEYKTTLYQVHFLSGPLKLTKKWRCLAAAKPSPPLFPGPHTNSTRDDPTVHG